MRSIPRIHSNSSRTPPTPRTTIDLIRHGEPVGGPMYRGGGRDDPLSERGWAEMRHAVANTTTPWQYIFSSPLRRCAAFAQTLGEERALPVTLDERLREIGFGSWEGKRAEELLAQDPELLRRFYRDPLANQPAGAEPPRTFVKRVGAVLEEILENHAGEHLLIVAHAGVIRAAVAHILDLPLHALFQIKVEYAHFTRLRYGDQRPPSLLFHGLPQLPETQEDSPT